MNYVDITKETQRIISFCTGVRGLERGIERTGIKLRAICYVEIEAFLIQNLVSEMEKGLLGEAPAINYVRFDLSTIADLSKQDKGEYKTGTRIWVGYKKKNKAGIEVQKEQKTFITHKFCPFCGKKYK